MAGDVRHPISKMHEARRLAGAYTVTEIARRLGVSHATVGRWLSEERRERDNENSAARHRRYRRERRNRAIVERVRSLNRLGVKAPTAATLLEQEFGGAWTAHRVRTVLESGEVPLRFAIEQPGPRTDCARCGTTLPPQTGRGRPRKFCKDCSLHWSHA